MSARKTFFSGDKYTSHLAYFVHLQITVVWDVRLASLQALVKRSWS